MARRRGRRLTPSSWFAGLALVAAACGQAGILEAPAGQGPACPPGQDLEAALRCHAPILIQETAPPPGAVWDRPTALDPDGSGTLRDDAEFLTRYPGSDTPPSFHARAVRDGPHLFLFYGLYYPADWSGEPGAPSLDHPGDFEGVLVVVDAESRRVEAAVTQAHNLFYLWLADPGAGLPPAASGTVSVEGGRVVVFAESGGHGLYAFGSGSWSPSGGSAYPDGPAALPADRLRRLDRIEVRPLEELEAFTDGPLGGFRDLPRGAKPPWLWLDRRHALLTAPGAIVLMPGEFYRSVWRGRRP